MYLPFTSLLIYHSQMISPSCRTHHDTDINAAKNIIAEALKLLASGTGAIASGGSVRPKPGRKSSVEATPREAGRHASISQK